MLSLLFVVNRQLGKQHSIVRAMSVASNKQRSVAIIGGGIAGLSCAQHLSVDDDDHRWDVTVYDTGRLRPGGRCSSRQVGDVPKPEDDSTNEQYPLLSTFRFDHAAQLIAAPSPQEYPAFFQQCQDWLEDGTLKEFPQESVYQISAAGKYDVVDNTFYHAIDGMGSLATNLVKRHQSFRLEQDVWVSPSSGVRYQKDTGKWKLQAKGKTLGYYDDLVIAHNGKCADRIMSQTPAKDLHRLLRVNFAPTVPAHGGLKMTLNSIYSLTVVVPRSSQLSQALPESFICGFVPDHAQLRMISCQTRKYPSANDDYEVWNILSSAKFAKKYKAPQEFLPPERVEEVTSLMLQAAETLLKLPSNTLSDQVLESRVQLWGAAVPLNVWQHGFLWEPKHNVGVVGDWLVDPSIAGAYTSGHCLAQHLKQKRTSSHGLVDEGSFIKSQGSSQLGIASLPLTSSETTATAV